MTRWLLIAAGAVVLALGVGVVGLLVLESSDDGAPRPAAVPGMVVPAQDGRESATLRSGNVILVAGKGRVAEARRFAVELAGAPATPALIRTGQAVVVHAGPGRGGIVAVAYEHQQRAERASDQELRRFVEYFLGRGA